MHAKSIVQDKLTKERAKLTIDDGSYNLKGASLIFGSILYIACETLNY
jgi:hypothetical protein